jgi:hypothetical protein
VQDTLKMKTPLSGSLSYYQQYVRLLEKNTERLRTKFPDLPQEPMRQLLEELDNNVEMVIEIIELANAKPKPQSPVPVR